MNPLRTVGTIQAWAPDGDLQEAAFAGSCFAFRWQNRLVTAAHCVRGIPEDRVVIDPTGRRGLLIAGAAVVLHPSADIAVVKAGGLQLSNDPMQCFTDIDDSRFLGEDLVAFGYPADVLGPDATLPVPRLFRGHIQRFIPEFDGGRYRYPAAELSFRCPGGLSGGPVFSLQRPTIVLAMATGNLQSTTVLESFEERPGHTVHYREMISYGVALTLTAVREWLDEHCPPRKDYSQPASLVG